MERETGIEPATNSLEDRQPFDYVGLSKPSSIPQALTNIYTVSSFRAIRSRMCRTVVRAFLACDKRWFSRPKIRSAVLPESGMSSSLQRRIEQLEQHSPAESNQLNVEIGYIQYLPPEYQGPRHLVLRDSLPWNGLGGCLYEWEEVEGSAAKDSEADSPNILRVELMGTEPYRLCDARRKREAEAQQNGVLR